MSGYSFWFAQHIYASPWLVFLESHYSYWGYYIFVWNYVLIDSLGQELMLHIQKEFKRVFMKTFIIISAFLGLTISCRNETSKGSMKAKINIPLNTAVFTRKNVIHEMYLITNVYHHEDGTWEFFDDISTNSNENMMIVSLGQILKRDSTITEILNMPAGYHSTRKSITDNWTVKKSEEEKE